MSKKIGRNDLCSCGSGKKYKKCCLPKQREKRVYHHQQKNQLKVIRNNTVGANISVKDVKRDKAIKWVRRMNKMPEDLKKSVNEVLDSRLKLKVRGCWYNSSILSLFIDGVKKVDGWYGINDLEEQDVKELRKLVSRKDSIAKKINNDLYGLMKGSDSVVLDLKNGVTYYRHSWNVVDGVHFDVTAELTKPKELWGVSKAWVHYIEDSVDVSSTFSPENWETSLQYVTGMSEASKERQLNKGNWKSKLYDVPKPSFLNRIFA